MSNGGLLEKAKEQQMVDEVVAEAVVEPPSTKQDGISMTMKIGAFMGVLGFVLMWFLDNYTLQDLVDPVPFGIIPLALFGGSFYLVWENLGRQRTAVLVVVYLLVAAVPYIAGMSFSDSITITDSELSDDSSTITLTIRGSSSANSADISISFSENEIFTESVPFSINRADGIGDYGEIELTISDWYQANSVGSDEYVVSVTVGASSHSFTLQSVHLQRTIDDVKSSTAAAIGTAADCDSSKDSCVVGVALTAWAGLDAIGSNPPGGLPFADYTLDASLMYEGSTTAITYPTVTVVNGLAQWDSNNGEYGGGSANVGAEGSQLPLEGSVDDFDLNTKFIPIEDWSVSDYGCYEFQVSVTQAPPWGDRTAHVASSYYEFAEHGDDGNGNPTDEAWTLVSNCD